ncbi:acetylcholine receptor subunit alpha-type acr-16-like [Pomacea canaliculata]|uniref:acetylcholine receptor subunit alpha-type acr-16-like n=1 Tax=Pomacea canaliculata TaxID=400727 RepID=UPI000D73CAEC|nr:acetylcholine receptor subunit alpha-type acr-16-like [Pomacea canaliculata]
MTLEACVPVCVLLLLMVRGSHQGRYEREILDYLFNSNYSKLERPVRHETDPVDVKFGITLQQLIDVDEKNQLVNTNLWLQMTWQAYNLVWNPADFGNVTTIRVPKSMLWVPDILMYNSASESFDATFPTNVVVSSDGSCLWVPPGMFKSTCAIDITWFPFDDQKCNLKFGSWSHDGQFLNLTEDDPKGGDISSFIRNGEWELIGVPVKRNVLKYDCCPEVYIDVTFTIHIRRRTLYYGFNIILPCVLISSLSLLLFVLPPDAGEKISLGTTILLSLMVFLLLVAETMPPTSDAVPLIGIYFACIMIMCSLSVLFTVLVLNLHHRSPETHRMHPWVKRWLCGWMAWVLRMERPGGGVSRRVAMQRARLTDSRLESLDEKSRSLMANVLDIDDDIRMVNGSSTVTMTRVDEGLPVGSVSVRHDIVCILKELRKITAKFRRDEEENDEKTEWKFAAMVIDRACFVVCILFTFGSTITIMLSAPHLIA